MGVSLQCPPFQIYLHSNSIIFQQNICSITIIPIQIMSCYSQLSCWCQLLVQSIISPLLSVHSALLHEEVSESPMKNQTIQKFIIKSKIHKPIPAKWMHQSPSHHLCNLFSFSLFSHSHFPNIPIFKFKCLVHSQTSKIIHPKSVITTPTSTHIKQ